MNKDLEVPEIIANLKAGVAHRDDGKETLARKSLEESLGLIEAKYTELMDDLNDQRLLYETTLEHSTEIENELSVKNDEINIMMQQMKKYLSSQLYDLIVHGKLAADTNQNRRKKLSIFFSDIVGFTDLTDSVEPELLSNLLNQYLNEMSKIAQKYGGTIDKFIGDAIMIYFGDSDSADDKEEAAKCVLMALEMQSMMKVIRDDWKKQGINHHLQIRIGINTGFCTVGNFGSAERMDYTIIGGQVNAAARLEHLSESGGIMVSGSTYLLVNELVEADYRGKVHVKGIQRPIDVYQILGRKDPEKAVVSLLKERQDGFELKPILFRADYASRLERDEFTAALQKALDLLKNAPEIEKKDISGE
ncbi:MAG: adenylate/guanylate cyclase domain-containing protein [Leptospiraceae bacterium]|nr:adenylate/guanylate cyclase domain-containing protein [Leptospiraceae bacterium]MCB1202115.1 adenylate/guanylate cyclase domain-containing protein [Leptospiraceae bacterium]